MPKISLSGANALDKYMKDADIENFINVLSKIQKDNAFSTPAIICIVILS